MTISLANALKSVKEDEHWIKKTIIGGLIYFVSIVTAEIPNHCSILLIKFLALAVSVLAGVYFSGFCIKTGNKMLETGTNVFAEWFENNIMLYGLKNLVIGLGYALIGLIIAFPIAFAGGFIFALLRDLVPNIFMITLGVILITIISLYLVQYLNAAYISFYKTLKISDAFNFKRIFRIIKENQHAAWTLVGKCILLGLLIALIMAILVVTLIGIPLMTFAYFLVLMVAVNLLVQYGREIDINRYF